MSSTGINPNDITDEETYSYAAGGIWPQIVGTVLLTLGSMAIALVLGIFSAVYLSEYSKQGPLIAAIRLAIVNLAGVPSIVFGLFGVALFVHFFGWNISLLAGWFTLAFMVLPVIITASEESLRAVPQGFREGSLALGATKWQTIYLNVLPYALPGILTSSVLGIARVAGETAPILFTAAYATADKLPWELQLDPTASTPAFSVISSIPSSGSTISACTRLTRCPTTFTSSARRYPRTNTPSASSTAPPSSFWPSSWSSPWPRSFSASASAAA